MSDSWYRARIDPVMCKDLVGKVFDKVVEALISPLTPEEINPPQKEQEKLEETLTVVGRDIPDTVDVLNQLFMEKKLSDGLPIVPPTREAVRQMLTGTTRSPEEVIGTFPPKGGIATVEKVAVNAVMAGARPEYFPVILAALDCLADKYYDVTFWRMSTSSSMPVIIISGPIADELNINSSSGLIGYGYRANASIGRAVHLTTMNMGHTWPGENDMAEIGRPNSHTLFTFAENLKHSPWESYAEEKGHKNVVLVSTAVAGSLVVLGGGAIAPWTEQGVLDKLVAHIISVGGLSPHPGSFISAGTAWTSAYTVVMHPECARLLRKRGMSKRDVQEYLYEKTKVPFEEVGPTNVELIQEALQGGNFIPEAVSVYENALKPGGMVPSVQVPDHIDIIVAGSRSGHTFVFGGSTPNPNHQIRSIL
ncbi:hypothetical protein HUE98_12970 [Candidatus Contubernalis alkalaceticus]|nr:hypothetical protein HUE98_12970 [Candidatus Contubernalis alkalaceticus]